MVIAAINAAGAFWDLRQGNYPKPDIRIPPPLNQSLSDD
jgi:hypothetical protein